MLDMEKLQSGGANEILDRCYYALPPQYGFQLEIQDTEALVLRPIVLKTDNYVSADKVYPAMFVWLRQADGSLHRGNMKVSLRRGE